MTIPPTGAFPRLPLSSRAEADPHHTPDPSGRRPGDESPSVVALGGGHGLSANLAALRRITPLLTAVVTVADDGGSSGRLRDELGVLPPGDLRMALAALCDDSEWGRTWRDVMQHRFSSAPGRATTLDNHALGNLLIVTLWELLGDPVAGLEWAGALLGARGRVLPMSTQPLVIAGDVPGAGTPGRPADPGAVRTITGQAVLAKQADVGNVRLVPPDAPACPQAVEAVGLADWVILGPGSWHTSVLPHLLLPALRRAICDSAARRCVTLNLSPDTETQGKTAADHLRVLHAYCPDLALDVVLADPSATEDGADLEEVAASLGAEVFYADVRAHPGTAVHNTLRLAAAYQEIFERHR
ncbi:uridine diphosphate-N-acetylglucosamine-binding protein YvcK [Kocuria sp. SM24M-10]|uniref:gluconeogenesis factor YvcK family protein n=1 Tax=Kocuria sp. SM24M-10 TaxID=1660349 RepID=UPI0006497348|nr:uridine diphosphate-N-acetylglucosamine-binding protein YvcK [Kocuria sp. SM24M-10]KLU08272.1 LPPG:FO 2-phospho-L-lactate transferase like protein [Kocuria sp. SM24M-10]